MVEFYPNDYRTWIIIANYYSLKNQPKNALECLEKSILIQESAEAYILLGFEYTLRSQFSKAISYFTASQNIQSWNPKAYFGMGIAYDGSL